MEEDKKKYEPPKAVRLDDKESGKGACHPTGSGDVSCTYSGNSATYSCFNTGLSAGSTCDISGSAAASTCNTGSGVA